MAPLQLAGTNLPSAPASAGVIGTTLKRGGHSSTSTFIFSLLLNGAGAIRAFALGVMLL